MTKLPPDRTVAACRERADRNPGRRAAGRPDRRVRRQLCRRRQPVPDRRGPARAALFHRPLFGRHQLCRHAGQLLDAPVDNFAIGGALTDNTNTNSPLLPGFVTEWNAFLAGGGGPFPTVSGTFDENDLVTVSIGGNDARFYQQTGGTLAGAPAAATASAAFATAGLNALVDAGAQNISFLAGDTSLLPEIAGDADPAGSRDPQRLFDYLQRGDAGDAGRLCRRRRDRPLSRRHAAAQPGRDQSRRLWAGRPRLPAAAQHQLHRRSVAEVPVLLRPAAPDLGRIRDRRPIYRRAADGAAGAAGGERHEPRRRPPVRPDADRADGHGGAARRRHAGGPQILRRRRRLSPASSTPGRPTTNIARAASA